MACSLELLDFLDKCYAEEKQPATTLKLVANWKMLPPDIVNIILQFVEQYNFEWYCNNFIRIDKITNSYIKTTHTPHFTSRERITVRYVGTPPVDTSSKFITPEVVLHKQSLPFSLTYIAQELEKRKQKSVDGNIKPSKMKCKYVKNIVQHAYIASINIRRWDSPWAAGGCRPHNVGKTILEAGEENLEWIKSQGLSY